MAARARWVLRPDNDVTGKIGDMRQELELAVSVACAAMIERERRGKRDRRAGDRRDCTLVLRAVVVVPRSFSFSWRVSGITIWSPPFQPATGCSRVSVRCPASGSFASRANVGVFAAPCHRDLAEALDTRAELRGIDRRVHLLIGNHDLGRHGGSHGRATVPTSRGPSITIRLTIFIRVLASVLKLRRPRSSMQVSFASLTSSYVTAWPRRSSPCRRPPAPSSWTRSPDSTRRRWRRS